MSNTVRWVFILASRAFHSSLFRAAGTYGFFSLLNSAIPFLLMPVFTRLLSPADYGIIAIFGVILTILNPFIALNGIWGVSRAFFIKDRFNNALYLGTVFLFGSLTWLIFTCFFYLFQPGLSKLFSFPEKWICIVPLAAFFQFSIGLILVSWQIREHPRPYGMFQTSSTLSEITLSLILVAYLGMGWEGRLSSRLFISALFSIAGITILMRLSWIKLRMNRECLLHSLKIGVPMIPHNLSAILNASMDRLFISHMIGLGDVGLYSVGYQIGGIIGLLATAFNNAYTPWIFKRLDMGDAAMKRTIVKFTYAYFFTITLLAITLSLSAPFLMNVWLGKRFQGSTIFIIWIAIGYAFDGMRYMVVKFLYFAEKTYLISAATMIGALCNLPLNFLLIKYNGAIGAAQATTIIHLVVFFITWFFAAKHYPMPWLLSLKKQSIREVAK